MENMTEEKKDKIILDISDPSMTPELLASRNEIDIELAELIFRAYKEGVNQYCFKFWSMEDKLNKLQVEVGQTALLALKKICS